MTDRIEPNQNGRDYVADAIRANQEASEYVAEVGGLPEITRAARDLFDMFEQTREEIATAEFASRFQTTLCEGAMDNMQGTGLNPLVRIAAETGGEIGLKRASLQSRLDRVEFAMAPLLQQLLDLRADLHVSQQDFEFSEPGVDQTPQE